MKRESAHTSLQSNQVAERLHRISVKRQEIIRPIFEHPRAFVLSSVRNVAERLGTDPATVIRIVRGLGFPGFREFQHFLHELSLAFATSADTMQRAAPSAGIPGHIADSLELDLRICKRCRTLSTQNGSAHPRSAFTAHVAWSSSGAILPPFSPITSNITSSFSGSAHSRRRQRERSST